MTKHCSTPALKAPCRQELRHFSFAHGHRDNNVTLGKHYQRARPLALLLMLHRTATKCNCPLFAQSDALYNIVFFSLVVVWLRSPKTIPFNWPPEIDSDR